MMRMFAASACTAMLGFAAPAVAAQPAMAQASMSAFVTSETSLHERDYPPRPHHRHHHRTHGCSGGCGPVAIDEPPVIDRGPQLPMTGSPVGALAATGAGLVALGALGLLVVRRRRASAAK
ncbi:LPXTG cell wall anchor domain-containing protein [Nonomuraea sp. NBC_01738]|uniref:LPXTG cell wall anchor domain-containing protein n=1 Tax=Nonomuraea sp. NBC_01738 TaxID=2976003 RepID=UPI002E1253B2|nr:LPXTG cell wall anchor domain-containing protein [Nonomuraea sp. NBC_01738]